MSERLAADDECYGERASPVATSAPPVAEPAEERPGQEAAPEVSPLPDQEASDLGR